MKKETIEKRTKDFEILAKNWDKIPERAAGRIEGITSVLLDMFLSTDTDKRAG